MEQRAKRLNQPVEGRERDVVYQMDARSPVKEPGTRWKFEPFKAGTGR
jgi:hypothetical protein